MMTKIRDGYKESEIGIIPEDWEALTVEKISIFVKDGSHGSHKDVEDGIPLLSAKDIIDNTIKIPSDCRKISKDDYNKLHKNYELQVDDVLITIVGTIGRTAIVQTVEKKFTLQRSVGIIRPNNLIDSEYLKQFMSGKLFQNQLKNSVNASAQGGVYLKTLSNLSCFVPPLPEQQRIAEILSTTDNHIEKLDKNIEDYQLLKKGMMKKLLTEGIGHTEFKETEIGRIPKEWEVKRLGECFEFYGGYTASRAQLTDEGRLYLHYGDIHLRIRSYIDTNEDSRWMPRYNVEKDKNGALLDTGDIVFADASEDYEGVGKSVVIIKGKEEIVAGLHTIVGKDINESFDLNYKRYFLGADYVRNQFRRLATGAKVYGISKGNIGQILVSIPCKEEQCVIGKTLARLERHIELLSNEKEELLLLKKSLMDKLLTGKVRVM